mmetsp:Transcript_17489/g.43634  ORF Transcript_17489/g.43634 Transcript_17489/m.43634 type:complete len:255 (-) Transcript_17489:695-1459(-)
MGRANIPLNRQHHTLGATPILYLPRCGGSQDMDPLASHRRAVCHQRNTFPVVTHEINGVIPDALAERNVFLQDDSIQGSRCIVRQSKLHSSFHSDVLLGDEWSPVTLLHPFPQLLVDSFVASLDKALPVDGKGQLHDHATTHNVVVNGNEFLQSLYLSIGLVKPNVIFKELWIAKLVDPLLGGGVSKKPVSRLPDGTLANVPRRKTGFGSTPLTGIGGRPACCWLQFVQQVSKALEAAVDPNLCEISVVRPQFL